MDGLVDSWSVTPCGHEFCGDCIEHALRTKPRCPVCRQATSVASLFAVTAQVSTRILGKTIRGAVRNT